ncbi:MAG: plastocyanin/azurin family copper-binding protein [Burkholderiales bacterium]|nr:plastocyanin/azurin family copper-binding protein [Burkholderiales bacterium]
MNLPTAHFATLCKYAGISFIAGAVNHGFFSGERSLLTAGIGVLAYLLGGILEMRASPDASQRWVDLLGLGIVSSIGLGFFTGGLQHFPDSPARSAWVVPLGFAMSLLAYWLMQGRDRAPLRTVLGYGLVTGTVVLAGSLIAWQMLIGAGGGGHDHASHSHGAAPAPAAAAVPVPSSSDTVSSQPAASASAPLRELRIEMDDTMRFSPSVLTVTAGERVRLVVVNRGKLTHELVIGTADELAHHQREMKSGSAAHHHHSSSEISVEAGQSREVIRSFDKSGELGIACFEPGHYEAGMKGKLTVLPRS